MLVGRDAELTVLDSLVAQATAGAGGVVLLADEPGVPAEVQAVASWPPSTTRTWPVM